MNAFTKRFYVVFLVYLFIQVSAYAKEEILAKITSDIDNSYALLVSEQDENGDLLHFYADQYTNGQRTERSEVKDSELEAGIVLLKKDRYEIIKIQASHFDHSRGGTFRLDTLYSAVSGEHKVYEFDMNIEDQKIYFEVKGTEFNRMHFIAKRSRILGPIGIEKIQFLKE